MGVGQGASSFADAASPADGFRGIGGDDKDGG
jgi:hypothetical protein